MFTAYHHNDFFFVFESYKEGNVDLWYRLPFRYYKVDVSSWSRIAHYVLDTNLVIVITLEASFFTISLLNALKQLKMKDHWHSVEMIRAPQLLSLHPSLDALRDLISY